MPIYVYEHVLESSASESSASESSASENPTPGGESPEGACAARFERIESVRAAALDTCPDCGRAVRRVPSRFAHPKDVLSTSHLKEKGFTRLRRRDKGVYEAD
jgi:hypothetical protein